jgi:hypothetical protein
MLYVLYIPTRRSVPQQLFRMGISTSAKLAGSGRDEVTGQHRKIGAGGASKGTGVIVSSRDHAPTPTNAICPAYSFLFAAQPASCHISNASTAVVRWRYCAALGP